MPWGAKAPKLWPAEPWKWKWIVSVGQPVGAVAAGHLAARDRSHDPVDVADLERRLHLFAPFQGRPGQLKERRVVQRLVQAMILADLAVAAHVLAHRRVPRAAPRGRCRWPSSG